MPKLAGTLGTGLFLGSGQALSGAGPLGALIAYSLVGTVAYSSVSSFPLRAMITHLSPKIVMFPGRNDILRTRTWLVSVLWCVACQLRFRYISNTVFSAARWVDPALGFAVGDFSLVCCICLTSLIQVGWVSPSVYSC